MHRVVVVLLAVLICCAHSTSIQQQGVGGRNPRRPAHQQPFQQQQSRGDNDGSDEEHYYHGRAEAKNGREGVYTGRPLLTTTTRAGGGVAESRTPQALAGKRSETTAVLRTVNGDRRSEAALEEADGRAAEVQGVETMDAASGENNGVRGGVVEPVEGGGAEEDKGIEEGEAEGFVVEARDDKEGDPGDSLDNDNASTSGISNNIMVIVFCALAFVANGGFLVYVFWVM